MNIWLPVMASTPCFHTELFGKSTSIVPGLVPNTSVIACVCSGESAPAMPFEERRANVQAAKSTGGKLGKFLEPQELRVI